MALLRYVFRSVSIWKEAESGPMLRPPQAGVRVARATENGTDESAFP